MIRLTFLSSLLAALASPTHALTCEELKSQVEAKIRAAGVKHFSVVVTESSASAPGRVVGNCGQGTKKLLYTSVSSGASPAAPAGPPASAAAPRHARPPVLTECKDGTVTLGGDCKK